MPSPFVTDARPSYAGLGTGPLAPADSSLHFCVRGEDAVLLSSVSALGLWGSDLLAYDIPAAGSTPLLVSASDLPGVLSAGVRADVYAAEDAVEGAVWVVEHTSEGVRQDGGLLYLMDAPEDGPWALEVDAMAPVLSGAMGVLPTVATYAGAAIYFLDGPSQRSICILFVREGDQTYAVVCSPPFSSSGERTVYAQVEVDWESLPVRWRVVWDGADTNTVSVECTLLQNFSGLYWAEGDTTVLYTGALPPQVFSEMRVGPWAPGSSRSGAVVVLDSLHDGDRVEVGRVWGSREGGWLLRGGAGARGHAPLVRSTALLQEGPTRTTDWEAEGAVTRTALSTSVAYADMTGAVCCEERVGASGWLLWCVLRLENSSHAGSIHTGAAIEIDDGERVRSVSLLDDYVTRYVGLLTGEDREVPADYELVEHDWRASTEIEWLGCGQDDAQYLFLDGGASPAASGARSSAGVPGAEGYGVRIGVGTTLGGSGLLLIDQVRLFPAATHYLPHLVDMPGDQGWEETVDGAWSIVEGELETDGVGMAFGYLDNGGDLLNQGTVVSAQVEVVSWEREGVSSPRRAEVGPFLWLATEEERGIGLCGVQDATGGWYVYLRSDLFTAQDVLRGSTLARAASAAVSGVDGRWWVYRGNPTAVEVWKDGEEAPVISVPWENLALVTTDAPHSDLEGAWVAFGQMQAGLRVRVGRVSAGRGSGWHVHLPALAAPPEARLGTEGRVIVRAEEEG